MLREDSTCGVAQGQSACTSVRCAAGASASNCGDRQTPMSGAISPRHFHQHSQRGRPMTQETIAAQDLLTQQEADGRAARISNTSYRLRFDITKGSPTYKGDEELRFELSGDGDTFLCHRGKTI